MSNLQVLCDGRSSCNLQALSSVFGNPCSTPSTFKYLQIKYDCSKSIYISILHKY